jgi:hypothetical protein
MTEGALRVEARGAQRDNAEKRALGT